MKKAIVVAALAMCAACGGTDLKTPCTPREQVCDGASIQECNADGAGWTALPCATGKVCVYDSTVAEGVPVTYPICK